MSEEKFHRAAKDGYLDLLRVATRKDLNTPDEDGMTPSHWAANYGNLDALRMIAGRGGDLDKSDLLGFTCLHHACRNGHLSVVSFMVHYGCNIWALDNDFHTGMDIALLGDKTDIASFLDDVHSKQQRKNPKVVQQLKEKATREAEQNVKRYERRTKEAMRLAEKEHRKMQQQMDPDFKPPSKNNIFNTLKRTFKGTKKLYGTTTVNGVTSYSQMAVPGTKRGVQRKILQKQASQDSASVFDFKVSEMDQSGKRTLRSLKGTTGIRKGSDILYMTNREESGGGTRPALAGVFGVNMKSSAKWRSEPDLLDSGVESNESMNNDEDEEDKPGLFSRPGIGKIAFLHTRHGLTGTLNSMTRSASADNLDSTDGILNGNSEDNISNSENGESTKRKSGSSDSIGTATSLEERLSNLPWNPEEVCSDDEEDETEFSALLRFLESCDLSHYAHVFTEQETDLEALMLLNDEDLASLGLKLGPRKKLLVAIKKRNEALANPGQLIDSHL